MQKKIILHLIYSLGRGGAETMLVQVLKKLTDYHNIVVTLTDTNHFGDELECDEYICLHQPRLLSFPIAAIKLKKLISSRSIFLVHSHLPMANFTARLAVPAHIPLVTTIHNSIASSGDYKKWFIRFIDKTTYAFRPSTIIGVSQTAMDDYFKVLQLKKKSAILLYNFVDTNLYAFSTEVRKGDGFKLISVGALSAQKNMNFLVNALGSLNHDNVLLDIYGKGQLQQPLQELIELNKANVVLKGQVSNIAATLQQYDVFVMSSLFEGFSLSVLEAMAAGLPLLLSDIPSFREQCKHHALYFSLDEPNDLVQKIEWLYNNPELRKKMAVAAKEYVHQHFTIQQHIKSLIEIYESSATSNSG